MGMNREVYTPGVTSNSSAFMARRRLGTHGRFFQDDIRADDHVLDLGCGPGSMTLDLACLARDGRVVGVDASAEQIIEARRGAAAAGWPAIEFLTASAYELPFPDFSFDRVFCHALMEHLSDPLRALRETWRVLKPGGLIGVCSPDADGWLLAPVVSGLEEAIKAYCSLQAGNGGNLRIGRHFGRMLAQAGFRIERFAARYECYPEMDLIGEYLALQFDRSDMPEHARTMRTWMMEPDGMFAQAWVWAVGSKV